MRILITGGKGMLGKDLEMVMKSESKNEMIVTDREELDITNIDETMKFVREVRPEVIINCAAYTNVDGCESDYDGAYKLNVTGAGNLAIAANEVNAAIMQISTDYVFDGNKGKSYLEHDKTNPLSVYGETKLAGEELVKNFCNKHYIVRTQWLFGKNGNNFVKTMQRLSNEKDCLMVVNDQFGSPTYTVDLCKAISELVTTPQYGTYHITNSEVVSWHEFTVEIMKQSGRSGISVEPCDTSQFPRPAARPAYSPLENYLWKSSGRKALRSFREALSDYLEDLRS